MARPLEGVSSGTASRGARLRLNFGMRSHQPGIVPPVCYSHAWHAWRRKLGLVVFAGARHTVVASANCSRLLSPVYSRQTEFEGAAEGTA